MTGWIVLAIALGGYIACYRVAYRFIADMEGDDYVDSEIRMMNVVMALVVSMVWPAVLIGWAVWLIATPTTAAERRQQVRELEDRRHELQREIAQAERELGIGKDTP